MHAARAALVDHARRLLRDRLVTGTSGNLSLRLGEGAAALVAITPSGVDYERMEPDHVVLVDLAGRTVEGGLCPSSELPMHLAVYRRRPDVAAIVHTHSPFATTLAVAGRPIPPVHYTIAALGVTEVPVTPRYALYGSEELAELAASTLGEGHALLLRQHGALATGRSLEEAYARALLVEHLAELAWRAALLGPVPTLAPEELARVAEQLRTYGQRP